MKRSACLLLATPAKPGTRCQPPVRVAANPRCNPRAGGNEGFAIKRLIILFLALLVSPAGAVESSPRQIPESSYDWWRAARFGVFIHWNASSVLQLGEGSWSRKNPTDQGQDYHKKGLNRMQPAPPAVITDGSFRKYAGKGGVPMEVYDNLFHVFNPASFDADGWVKTFKEAGAGYVVFTAKHHDGFCMFDSKLTDYDIMNTPFGRDIAKELAAACRRHGLKLIWYYSKCDWFEPRHDVANPGPYVDYLSGQIRELLTIYGDVAGIWWDAGEIVIPTRPLFDMMLQLQPHLISNGRIQSRNNTVPGVSFGTPEQELGAFNLKSPWESCVTMQGESWFWNGGKDIRSADSCLRLLVGCAAGDGNLLLDFGPDEQGRMHPSVRRNFLSLGQWLQRHGESVYGTRGGPYMPDLWGGSTRRDNAVYLHITQTWPGGRLHVPPLPRRIVRATRLAGGDVPFTQTGEAVNLEIAPSDHERVDTVVRLELDGSAMDIAPIPPAADHWKSLTVDAAVTASSHVVSWAGQPPACVVLHAAEKEGKADKPRGHIWRYWMARADDPQPWIAVDLGRSATFSRIRLHEKFNRIRSFQLQVEKDARWETIHAGTSLDVFSLCLASPVTAQRIRLLITAHDPDGEAPLCGPGLQEFDIHP